MRLLSSKKVWITLLIISLLVFTILFIQFLDLDPHDEGSMYLYRASLDLCDLIYRFWIEPDWGPLYSCWYYLLSFFTRDPISLYFLSSFIITLLLPIVFFKGLRLWGHSYMASLICAMVLFFNPNTLFISRKPNHFALLICFLLMVVARKFKRNGQLIFVHIVMLIIVYVRPEYLAAGICTSILLIILFFKQKKKQPLLLLVLIPTILIFFSFNHSIGNKSFIVFKAKTVERYDFKYTFSEIYGDSTNILSSCSYKPRECLSHLAFNFSHYFYTLGNAGLKVFVMVRHFLLLPFIITCFLLLMTLYFDLSRRERLLSPLFYTRQGRHLFYLLSLFLIPTVSGSLLFGPLDQYVVGHLAIGVAILMLFIPRFKVQKWTGVYLSILAIGAMMGAFSGIPQNDLKISLDRRVLKEVEAVRKLKIKGEIRMFSDDLLYGFYLPLPVAFNEFLHFHPADQTTDYFVDIIQRKDINIVVFNRDFIGNYLARCRNLKLKKYLENFMKNYSRDDFTIFSVSPELLVWVRNDLLIK